MNAGICSKRKRVGKLADYELFSYYYSIVNCIIINIQYSILYLSCYSDAASSGRSSRLSISARPTTEMNSSRTTSSMAVPCAEIDLSSTLLEKQKVIHYFFKIMTFPFLQHRYQVSMHLS